MTAAGSATTVEVGSTLAISSAVDVGIDNEHYALVYAIDEPTLGSINPSDEAESEDLVDGKFVTTLTGILAGDVVISTEIKSVSIVDGVRTLTSLDPAVTDSITIHVLDINRFATFKFDSDDNTGKLTADVVGTVNATAKTVAITIPVVAQDVSFDTDLVAQFTMALANTTSVYVGETEITSGTTEVAYASPVTMRINALDAEDAVIEYYDWTITVTVAS